MKNIVKNIIKKYFLFSFKTTMISLYVPVIVFFILAIAAISYLLATSQIQENAFKSINDTVFQTKGYLENRMTDVFEQLVTLANDPKTLSIISKTPEDITPDDYISMDQSISRIYFHHNTMIESIFVNLHQGEFTYTKRDQQTGKVIFSFQDYVTTFQGKRDGYYWRNLHIDDVFSSKDYPNYVISTFKLIGNKDSDANGIILFNLRADFFEKVFNKSLIGDNGYLTLISKDGYIKSKNVSKEYQLDETVLNYMESLKEETGQFEFQKPDGKKMIVIFDTLGVNKWKVAAVFPEEEILEKAHYIKYVTLFAIIILVVIAVLIANGIAKYLTEPIRKLVDHVKQVNQDNVHIPFTISNHVPMEIVTLNNGMNDLMVKINELLNQVRIKQEEKRQLEFAIIHAQINPHFLYNTLYSIKSLCDMGQNEEASTMISSLSSFFRISISKGKEIIKIKDELEHIKHYLYIQEMRYGDEFSYRVSFEPKIVNYHTIKLTLQPIIENAIYHGVKQSRGMGEILVKGYEEHNQIVFEVKDNGRGITQDRLLEIKKELYDNTQHSQTIGIGLKSVHERIVIHFGFPYGVTIESEQDKGTTVKIIIPKVIG